MNQNAACSEPFQREPDALADLRQRKISAMYVDICLTVTYTVLV